MLYTMIYRFFEEVSPQNVTAHFRYNWLLLVDVCVLQQQRVRSFWIHLYTSARVYLLKVLPHISPVVHPLDLLMKHEAPKFSRFLAATVHTNASEVSEFFLFQTYQQLLNAFVLCTCLNYTTRINIRKIYIFFLVCFVTYNTFIKDFTFLKIMQCFLFSGLFSLHLANRRQKQLDLIRAGYALVGGGEFGKIVNFFFFIAYQFFQLDLS